VIARAAAVLIACLALQACGGADQAENEGPDSNDDIAEAPAPPPTPFIEQAPPSTTSTGLTPLSSADTVISDVPLGREDPF